MRELPPQLFSNPTNWLEQPADFQRSRLTSQSSPLNGCGREAGGSFQCGRSVTSSGFSGKPGSKGNCGTRGKGKEIQSKATNWHGGTS